MGVDRRAAHANKYRAKRTKVSSVFCRVETVNLGLKVGNCAKAQRFRSSTDPNDLVLANIPVNPILRTIAQNKTWTSSI